MSEKVKNDVTFLDYFAIDMNLKQDFLFSLLAFYSNYSPDMSSEEIFKYYELYDQKFGLPHKHKWKPFAQPKVTKNKLKIGGKIFSFYVNPAPDQDKSVKFFPMNRHSR